MNLSEEQYKMYLAGAIQPIAKQVGQLSDDVATLRQVGTRPQSENMTSISVMYPTFLQTPVDIINNIGTPTTEYTWESFDCGSNVESGARFAIVSGFWSDNNANKTILLEGRDKDGGVTIQIFQVRILDDPDNTGCFTQVFIPLSGTTFEHQLTVTGGASPTDITDNFVFQLVGYL